YLCVVSPCSAAHSHLHSSPTRRSSDLANLKQYCSIGYDQSVVPSWPRAKTQHFIVPQSVMSSLYDRCQQRVDILKAGKFQGVLVKVKRHGKVRDRIHIPGGDRDADFPAPEAGHGVDAKPDQGKWVGIT